VPLLDRPRIVVGEAIDADDIGAIGEQPLGERRADESRSPCDECFHVNHVLTRSGSRHGRPTRSSVAWTVVPVASVAASASRTTSYVNCTRTGESIVPVVRTSRSSSYLADSRYVQCASITGRAKPSISISR